MPRGMREYVIKDGKVYPIVRIEKSRRILLPKTILEQVKADTFIAVVSGGKIILEPIELEKELEK